MLLALPLESLLLSSEDLIGILSFFIIGFFVIFYRNMTSQETKKEDPSNLGMGTRRPGTRQDLGPGTSRGLAEESQVYSNPR